MSQLRSEAARELAAGRTKEPKVCAHCGQPFTGYKWAKYCGPACVRAVYWDAHREELNRKRRERYQREKAG